MAAEMARINADFDISDSEEVVEQPRWNARRTGLVALGLTCLAACAVSAAAALAPGDKSGGHEMITARALLQSDEMIKIQARNQIRLLKQDADEKKPLSHRTFKVLTGVAKSIKKIEDQMQAEEPARWRKLNEVRVSPEQKDAVLRIIAGFSDPRVQELGHKVAKAFADGRIEGRDGVKRRLSQVFNKDELPTLRKLKNEFFHGLHTEASEGSDVTFDVDSLRLLKALPDGPGKSRRLMMDDVADDLKDGQEGNSDETSVAVPGSMGNADEMSTNSDNMEEALNFFGAMTEQTRVFLDQIDFVGNSFGWDSQIPSAAKSGVGALDFFANVADCVSRAGGNDVKEGMCPFKYGSAAFDAISCIDNMLGISNARMGVANENGKTAFGSLFSDSSSAQPGGVVTPGAAPSPSMSTMFDQLTGSSAPAPAPAAASNTFAWN